jgi:hypothetical protein
MKKSIVALALIAAGALAGCHHNGSADADVSAPNAPKAVTAPKAAPSATDSTKLKSGAAPLSYLVGPGGPIRIVDTTANKTTKVTAAPNAIVTIDEAKGISVSNTVVKPGPLKPGHQYEIWLDHQ